MQTAPQSVVQKEATLTRLMETYGTNVLRVCFLYLHDHALAQDAAQTTSPEGLAGPGYAPGGCNGKGMGDAHCRQHLPQHPAQP